MDLDTLRLAIEAGTVQVAGVKAPIRVAIREERLNVRFSSEEMRALDKEAAASGIGQSRSLGC